MRHTAPLFSNTGRTLAGVVFGGLLGMALVSCDSDDDSGLPPLSPADAAKSSAVMAAVTLESFGSVQDPPVDPTGAEPIPIVKEGTVVPDARLVDRLLGLTKTWYASRGTDGNSLARSLTVPKGDVLIPCTSGGEKRRITTETSEDCTITVVYNQCEEPVGEGVVQTTTGSVTLNTSVVELCSATAGGQGAQAAGPVDFSVDARALEALVIVDSTQLDSRFFVNGTYAGTLIPSTCAGEWDLTETINAQVDAQLNTEGINLRVIATGLALDVEQTERALPGGGTTCDVSVLLNGTLDIQDRTELGFRLILTYVDFGATLADREDGSTEITLSGAIRVSCLGDVVYETLEPIVSPPSGCPTAGRVRLRVVNTGQVSVMVFQDDGSIEILDADGNLIERLDSCDALDVSDSCSS